MHRRPLFFLVGLMLALVSPRPVAAQSQASSDADTAEPKAAPANPPREIEGEGPAEKSSASPDSTTPSTHEPNPALASDSSDYVEELLRRARRQELHLSRAWLRLGHWQADLISGWRSEADGAAFFLAKQGKVDPQAELKATLEGFFRPPPPPPPPLDAGEPPKASPHALCRFPARLMWLSQALALDPRRLPSPQCARFQDYWRRVRPKAVSLVFSSYYLNNPSSAFGHTFFRVHKHRDPRESDKQILLDNGIDFSAEVTTENAVLYAVMGMTGMFKGQFKRLPYFYKIREYNDYESRDLWEYDLNLSDQAIAMLVAHVWELGATYFDYFYLTENCSYHILGVLEAADPSLELLSHLRSLVLPVDTIHALYRNPGLVRGLRFRPSLRTHFRARIATLSSAQRLQVTRLASAPDHPLPASLSPMDQVAALDAAVELVELSFTQEILLDKESEGARRKQRLLERRAGIRVPSPPLKVPVPAEQAPHLTHPASRAGLGMGITDGGTLFQSVRWRAHLHDLADPSPGLPDLAQLEFFAARLRIEPAKRRLRLEELDLVHVASISSLDRFNLDPSWDFRLGLLNVEDAGCADCLGARADFSGGIAHSFFGEAFSVFLMSDFKLFASPELEGIKALPVRMGIGASGGLRWRLHPRLIALLQGGWRWYPGVEPGTTWDGEATLRWGFAEGWALGLEGRSGPSKSEAQALLFAYY